MQRPTVAPVQEPVTLAEARLQCRLSPDDTSEDTRLRGYIAAARGMAEQQTGARLITQTWQLVLDAWPSGDDIVLPQTPAQSVESVVYVNTAGAPITLASNSYRLDLRDVRAVLRPAYGTSWPTVRDDVGVITITYKVGFGDLTADVPECIREWMLAHIDAMFENRSAHADMEPLPYLARLLDEWRVYG